MILFILLISIGSVYCQVDCSLRPDGSYGWGCKSYTKCVGGNGTLVDCLGDLVFNEETGECDDPLNVGPPCGLWRNCSGIADGAYADHVLNCTAFYNCLDDNFLGHNPCNPGLVFNEEEGVCDWPENVDPPCGTKGTDPPTDTADLPFYERVWKTIKNVFT